MKTLPTAMFLSAMILLTTFVSLPVLGQAGVNPDDIKITVPPTIRTVEFRGNTLITSEELRQKVGIQTGQLLTEQILRSGVTAIRDAYAEQGYLVAITDITFPQAGEVGPLTFILEEVKISAVNFVGLRRTREDVLRQMLQTQPGQFYNRRIIQADVDKLQSLGLFENIEPRVDFTDPGAAVIIWNLEERAKPNFVNIGGSIGQSEGVLARVNLTLSNIRGRLDTLRVEGLYGARESTFGGRINYFNPLVAPKRTSLTAQVYDTFLYRFDDDLVIGGNLDNGSYYERHAGVDAMLSRQQRQDLNLSAGFRYENVDTNNLSPQVFSGLTSLDSTVYVGTFRGIRDRRDSIEYPTGGTLWTANLIAGGANLEDGGSGGIAKGSLDGRWYRALRQPVRDQTGAVVSLAPVIAFRAAAGTSIGDLPFTEQFFVGGIGAIPLRGYREDRFWGKHAAIASAEYRRSLPILKNLVGVAFVDAGDAWGSDYQFIEGVDTDFPQHEGFSLNLGAGVGLRYGTPVGQLALDFAYGEEFRVHFNLGLVY